MRAPLPQSLSLKFIHGSAIVSTVCARSDRLSVANIYCIISTWKRKNKRF